MLTVGGTLGAATTLTVTGAEVVTAPESSVARARSVTCPSAFGVHVSSNGDVSSLPTEALPASSSTRATRPSSSVAVARTVTGTPMVSVAPFTGDAIATAGGRLGGGNTVTSTPLVVTLAPTSSVARAAIVCAPVVVGVHASSYGAASSLPSTVVPSRNSTRATLPSMSSAVARSVSDAPSVIVVGPAGFVSVTCGGTLAGTT